MIFSIIYFIVYFLLFLALLCLLVFNRRNQNSKYDLQPRVSILIAARNEEHTILRCLTAIENLHYPKDKLEILIGDDASTDATRQVVLDFIRNKPGYTCIPITENLGEARGKANVLAHLANYATTDFFFYTDADIAVPQDWIQGMLSVMQEDVGVVTGITSVEGDGFFAEMQALDWYYALGLVQVVSDLKLPVTSMGNNMLLRRKAYEDVGGFESIKFSITEDIAIFNAILKKGWKFRNLYQQSVLAKSTPAATFWQFMHQRKRWMKGTAHLPLYMAIIFVLHAAYYPVLLPFYTYTSVGIAFLIFVVKLILQSIFLYLCLKRIGERTSWWNYVLFEIYMIVSSIILIIFFFLPSKVNWKGRKY